MSAPPNSPNSMASTRAPSDIDSMDVTTPVPKKKRSRMSIEERRERNRLIKKRWMEQQPPEVLCALYKKANSKQSTKDRKAEWWSKNKARLNAARRANLDTL